MPQNTEYNDTKSKNQPSSYRNRLNGWAIARVVANQERVIVARFRSRSDADGYIQHLRQIIPTASFEIFFDSHREEVTV
jgi:hypothetical protein